MRGSLHCSSSRRLDSAAARADSLASWPARFGSAPARAFLRCAPTRAGEAGNCSDRSISVTSSITSCRTRVSLVALRWLRRPAISVRRCTLRTIAAAAGRKRLRRRRFARSPMAKSRAPSSACSGSRRAMPRSPVCGTPGLLQPGCSARAITVNTGSRWQASTTIQCGRNGRRATPRPTVNCCIPSASIRAMRSIFTWRFPSAAYSSPLIVAPTGNRSTPASNPTSCLTPMPNMATIHIA